MPSTRPQANPADTGSRVSEARERLLATASAIFYAEGIHAVGVDRIVAEAQVTRATFYRHFPGKEDLVVAYLDAADQAMRGQVAAVEAHGLAPAETLRAIGEGIAEGIRSSGFRGCAFLNAAAEYPEGPVNQVVLAHREWLLGKVTALLTAIEKTSAEGAGRHFVMMRDGAMAAGCLFDPAKVSETFLDGVDGLLRVHAAR